MLSYVYKIVFVYHERYITALCCGLSLILSFCGSNRVYAFDQGEQTINHIYTKQEMVDITTQAVTKRDDVKLLMKNSENWFNKSCDKIGVSQKILIPVTTIGSSIIAKKISTKGIHMYISPKKDLTIRPDLDYYFNKTYNVSLTSVWRF